MDLAPQRLELGVVQNAITKRVRTPLGAGAAQRMVPFADWTGARARIELIEQGRSLLQRAEEPPVSGAEDVRTALDLGEKGARLDGDALRAIARTMATCAATRRFLLAREELVPGLYALGASIEDLQRTADEVLHCFGPDGRLADHASPELGPLRQRLRTLHEKIEEKLHELLHSEEVRRILQESYFTVRGDRYVLPVKASFQGEMKGIVHDASSSGQTVFIEPQAVVDLGNRLKIAQSAVKEEEDRILSALTELVVEEAAALRAALVAIEEIDLLMGCAKLAEDLRCVPVIPTPGADFQLFQARHPLLALQKLENPALPLVANDLGLKAGQRVLVLTGPNTGGKTVALKTIGLFALMVRLGLHLPCREDSRIGWFSTIEAAIGDQQSIEAHLSTFAAHVKDLIRILEAAGPSSLVLLDEVAADTDPTQGQALAQAILEAFADRGSLTVATTHFEQLKALPYSDARFRNAGVGFDPRQLRPTYKVELDVPQSSSAMEIAASLGLDAKVVERARALTGENNRALEALLHTLQDKTAALEDARLELKAQSAALERAREQLEHERQALRDLESRLIQGERGELIGEIESQREELRRIISGLQEAVASDAVRDAMRMAQEAQVRLDAERAEQVARFEETVARGSQPPSPIADAMVGDWVHVPKLGKDGEIVALEGKMALVSVGSMRTRLGLDELTLPQTKRPKKTRAASKEIQKALEDARIATEDRIFTSDESLDLRGHTAEEAIARIDAFLDHHYGGTTTHVRLVHGHGSGALKKAVRDHLARSGYARAFRAGKEHEGGDGVTVVSLV